MDYGRHGTIERHTMITAKSKKIKNKLLSILVIGILFVFSLFVVVGLCAGFGVWKGIIDTAPEIDTTNAAPTSFYTTVLAQDGGEYVEVTRLVVSGANRKYVNIEEVPQNLRDAFVAIEDERFYEHNGIDIYGIIRAGFSGLAKSLAGGSFDQGASTITQQLIKNNVLTSWTSESSFIESLQRKIQEQYLAVQLEKQVSKEWILESYMNTINLGANSLGVQAAAQKYFGKDVSELTLSECAVIAGISQNPSAYNPIIYPENNEIRREQVLENMLNQGYITQAEYDSAAADTDVYHRIEAHINTVSENTSDYDSYFIDAMISNVYEDLVASGYSETEANRLIYEGGLTIYTSQDLEIQRICDEEVNNMDNYESVPNYSFSLYFQVENRDGTISGYTNYSMQTYLRKLSGDGELSLNYSNDEACYEAIDEYIDAMCRQTGGTLVEGSKTVKIYLEPQIALTIMDQSTGEIKAIVGGRGEKTGNRTWNRATNELNQPGSVFKVLACYSELLDLGIKNLSSLQVDEPLTIDDGEGKWVVNNNDKTYAGSTNIRVGLRNSVNVVAVKNMIDLIEDERGGWDTVMSYLEAYGFTTLSDDDRILPTALGGITNGVNLIELTAAMATIANGGVYLEPKYYTKVVDREGNVILDIATSQESHRVISEQTAYLLTSVMEDVMTKASGKFAYIGKSMAQAGKTGTTNLNRDALFSAYTPYYICTIWGGNDDNTEQTNIRYPRYLWKAIMKRIHENLEYRDFEMPEGIVELEVCSESGLPATEGVCTDTYMEYFNEAFVPEETCHAHQN